jgi:murein tripeptide amidase MpaA
MPDIHFDRYYRYDDLTRLLHAYAEENPNLVMIHSIGKSHEDRDIWLLTVTNSETGSAEEKPALWVDGNIHATEVSASAACPYHLNTLVTQYGKDENITRCLDTRAFYICPRINPDGAELALATNRDSFAPAPVPIPTTKTLLRASPMKTSTATAASSQCEFPTPMVPGNLTLMNPVC